MKNSLLVILSLFIVGVFYFLIGTADNSLYLKQATAQEFEYAYSAIETTLDGRTCLFLYDADGNLLKTCCGGEQIEKPPIPSENYDGSNTIITN